MLHRPPGHFTWHAPLPLHSTEHAIPVHVTTQASFPSQMQLSPGAQDFVVVGPVPVVPPSVDAAGEEDSDEHAASTTKATTTEKDFMRAS
jgi:hypothetical protein